MTAKRNPRLQPGVKSQTAGERSGDSEAYYCSTRKSFVSSAVLISNEVGTEGGGRGGSGEEPPGSPDGGLPWYEGHIDRKSLPGLSNCIEPPKVISGPNVLRLTGWRGIPRPKDGTENDPPPRGKVRGISRKSAARLSEILASVRIGENVPCIHLTLTLPKAFERDCGALKRRFKTMAEWLSSHGYFGLWRLEFQKRGAPHWHVILWNLGHIGADAEELDQRHRRVVAHWKKVSGNPSDQAAFISPGDGRARWYLACHHAKTTDQGIWPDWWKGQAWGFINRPAFDEWEDLTDAATDLSPAEILWLMRFNRRFVQAGNRRRFRRSLAYWEAKGKKGPRPKYRKYRLPKYATGFRLYCPDHHHGAVLAWAQSIARQTEEKISVLL